MAADELVVHGAREHNLKDITVRLPRNRLICITGLSGSGKSSLAFDTIYAEGLVRGGIGLLRSPSGASARWEPSPKGHQPRPSLRFRARDERLFAR